MSWYNYYGFAIMAIIMIPNIVYAVKHKDVQTQYDNRAVVVLEQIGRYGCFILMIFNIPYTWTGFWFSYGLTVYIAANAVSVAVYSLAWVVFRNNSGIVKALLLSIIPSIVFVFSAVMIGSIPLFVFAVIFAVTHITISVKNAGPTEKPKKKVIVTLTAIFLTFIITVISTVGGIAIYGRNSFAKLENMSAREMIDYDCSDKYNKIAVAIIENGKVTRHNFGHDGEENTLYDFEIGSVSKTFVGLMCAKAMQDGKLNLSDSISEYLDLDDAEYYPTVERLLTHTSGYKSYYFESKMIGNKLSRISNDFYGISRDRILNRVRKTELENKDYPFEYSNFGISVLGLVLEKIYNDDFTNLLNDFIANEAGLSRTKAAEQRGNLKNYWMWKENDGYIPAGSIISNIEDMSGYLNLYLSDSLSYASRTYSEPKTIDASDPNYEKTNIRMDGAGMTWMIDNKNGIVWHNGATSHFNGYIGFTGDRQKGVVILSNIAPNDRIPMTVIGAKILTAANSF